MNKLFPKSRVCAIDASLSIEQGLKKALGFAKHYNITLNSNDGKKIIYTFCLKQLEQDYSKTQSPYNKVLFVSKDIQSSKIKNFVDKYFDNIIKHSSIPYCGRHNINSPDLETAAQHCAGKHTNFTQQKFKQFLKTLTKQ